MKRLILVFSFSLLGLFAFADSSFAAVRTWDGGGGDNNWSTAANWSSDTAPVSGVDSAVFDGTSTKNATIDVAVNVVGLSVNAGYTGTITGGANDLDVNGTFTQAAGTFIAPTGNMFVSGGWTHTAGGTFTHNSGTVTFDGAAGTTNVATTETFGNLVFSKNAGVAQTISSGDTLVVTGTLTLTEGAFNTGTVEAQNAVTHSATFDGGTGTLSITGATSRTINLVASGELPATTLNSSGTTMNGAGSGTVVFDGNFTIQNGTFTGGAGNIDLNGAFSLTSPGAFTAPSGTFFVSGGWTHTDASTFTHNSGTVTFDGATATVNVNTTETFANLTINKNAGIAQTVTAGDTLVVTGTLTLTEGLINTGTVEAQNAITHSATFDGGTGTLSITGATVRSISLVATGELPATTVNSSGTTINGNGSGTVVFDGALTWQDGTFSGGAGNIDLNAAFVLSGGSFTAPSGTFFVSGGWTHTAGGTFTHNSGTVTFDGAAATMDVATTETFNHLTINKNANANQTITSGDTLVVTGTLTLTEGNIATGTVEAQNGITHSATFDGGTGTLLITGATVRTVSLIATGQLPATTINSAGTTMTGANSGTVTFDGSLTLQNGVFTGDAGAVDLNGTLVISGGTFTAPTGSLNISTGFTHTAGGTWSANNGTVVFDGTGTVDVSTSETFVNLSISGTVTVTSGDTLVTTGTLTLTDGNINIGTVEAQGPITHTSTFDGGTGTLTITGATVRTLALVATGQMPATTNNSSATTITGPASGTTTFDGALTITTGTFTGDAGAIDLNAAFVLSGGSFTAPSGNFNISGGFTHTAGGTWSANNGTVILDGAQTVDVATSETFVNLTTTSTITVTSGDTLVVTGMFTMTNGVINTGTIEVQNGMDLQAAADGGTGLLHIVGATVRTMTVGINADMPGVNMDTAGGTIQVSGPGTTFFNELFTLNNGVFDAGSASIFTTTNDGLVINGGTFTMGAGDLTIGGLSVFSMTGGTFNQGSGEVGQNGGVTFTQTGGTFNGGSGEILFGSLSFTNTAIFTSTSGLLNVNSGTFTVGAGATFNHNNGDVQFSGAADVDGTETFYDISGLPSSIAVGDTIITEGEVLLHRDIVGGTLQINGTVNHTTTSDGSGFIVVGGAGVRTVTFNNVSTSNDIGNLTINSSGATVETPATAEFQVVGPFVMADGVFDGNNGALLSFFGDFTQTGGTFNAPSGIFALGGSGTTFTYTAGTFTHNNGTVHIQCNEMTIDGTPTFYNLMADCQSSSEDILFGAGSTTTIEGRFQVYGNGNAINVQSDADGSPADIVIEGTAFFHNAIVQDIHATGAVELVCLVGCTNVSGNSGIRFGQPGYLVTDVQGFTTEAGGTTTFEVSLRSSPMSNVVIPVSSGDATEGSVSTSSLTFTSANWATPQTVTVTGLNDALDDGGITFTVVLGSPTTSDTVYAGLNPSDVSVVNADDDDPDGAVGFDLDTLFTREDVKDTATPDALWFEAGDGVTASYGHGNLLDGSGGAPADLTVVGSKIQPGCTVIVSGEEYIIHSLNDYAVTGYNVTLMVPDLLPDDLGDAIVLSGAVDAIYCAQFTGDGYTLPEEPILTQFTRTTLPGSTIFSMPLLYDAVNDTFWTSNTSDDELYRVDGSDGTLLGTVTTGVQTISGSGQVLAYDTSSDAIWVLNGGDGSVTKLVASTGAYFNGTLGASTFLTGTTDGASMIYDDTHDDLWIGHSFDGPEIVRMDTDGTVLSTITGSGFDEIQRMLYVPADDALWVAGYFEDPVTFVGHYEMTKYNATTEAYFNGTRSNSSALIPTGGAVIMGMLYDSIRDVVWIVGDSGGVIPTEIMMFDADTMELSAAYPLRFSQSTDMILDTTRDVILITDESGDIVTEVDPDTGDVTYVYTTGAEPKGLALDPEGDVWIVEPGSADYLSQNIMHGVPYGQFYSATTTDSSQVDTSTWDQINSLAVTEDDDGQSLYYAVSFDDRRTFAVFTGGTWRAIASDLASVHGGVDGTWYYRNNASVWTAASTSAASRALSQAVDAGANNRMVGSTVAALTSSDWEQTGGFTPTVTTTIDLGIALKTDDPRDPPVIDELLFDFEIAGGGGGGGGGGGSGSASTFVSNASIVIEGGDACSVDTSVQLSLSATNASEMLVSNLSDLSDATWQTYTASLAWTLLPGDGGKTVYVRYRSSSGNMTTVYADSITVDAATQCGADEEEAEEEPIDEPEETEGEPEPEPSTVDEFTPEHFVRTIDDGAVYFVDADGVFHAFPDLQTYLSYTDGCGTFLYVDEDVLSAAEYGPPMLPRASSVLVKFPESPKVYAIEDDGTGTGVAVLRWISSEEVAIANFGADWSDYIITLFPSAEFDYTFGTDVIGYETALASAKYYTRAALNQAITYDIYIINPDGTKRSAFSDYAQVTRTAEETLIYGIEDKGSDFDYNDVVIDVDPRSCLELHISVRPLEAAWHHQIGISVYYEGVLKKDAILWTDSHTAVGSDKRIDLSYVDSIEVDTDEDNDGLGLSEEEYWGTDPTKADTDGDGYTDGLEVEYGYDPTQSGGL